MENWFPFILTIIAFLIILIFVFLLITDTVKIYDTQSERKRKRKKFTKLILTGLVLFSGLRAQQSLAKYYESTLTLIPTHSNITETQYIGSKDLLYNFNDSYTKSLYEPSVSEIININADTTDFSAIMTLFDENKRLIPNREGDIFIPIGTKVCFNCTTSWFKTSFGNKLNKMEAIFLGNKEFSFNGEIHKLSEIECESILMPTIEYKDELIVFTHNLGDGKSIPVMTVSFDRENYVTRYVNFKIYPATMNCKKGVKGKNFTAFPKHFDKINIKNCLKHSKVEKEFCELLNMNSQEIQVFLNKNQSITRGHLAAKKDFIYSGDQKATFDFLNICFQWQTINNCNCSAIEEGTRAYAYENNVTLTCYAGSMGVCTLPDKEGAPKELYIKCNNDVKIPVPKFIFRIVICDKTGKGIAFIVVNNPFLKDNFEKAEYIIGNDVSDQIDWIKWDRKNIQKGYAYAISVPEFIAAVSDFPLRNLHTSGLLGVKSI